MFYPLSLWIGLRHAQSRRRQHFISFISLIAMAGIALGVAVLITVIAVMNGFEKEVRLRILEAVAHVTLTDPTGSLSDWVKVAQIVASHPEVSAVAPFIHGGAMVSQGHRMAGVLVRGILPEIECQVAEFANQLVSGQLTDLTDTGQKMVIGRALAKRLGINLGDTLSLVTAHADSVGTDILPTFSHYTVVGIFDLGMRQYDEGLIFIHLSEAAKLFGLGDRVSGLRLKVKDVYQSRRIAREVVQILPHPVSITDWSRQNSNFFIALNQQRQMMFVILGLIVAVAAFNIVSTLVMVVSDKAAVIAILRTLGMTPRGIMAIFMVQGSVIGLIGLSVGITLGVSLALHVTLLVSVVESYFGIHFLSPEVYPINYLPSDLHWADIFYIGIVAFILSLAATLYPAWRAAATRPAEVLSHQ